MDYAKKIISELLTEEVTQDKLVYAIKKRHEVSFVYDNGDGKSKGKGERITVQPVAYGLTKSGNPCFRAYQINGSSESTEEGKKVLPGWRLFLLSNVKDGTWKDSNKVFNEPPKYNESGDKSMSQVYVIADFKGSSERYERGGLKKYNADRLQKNIEKNPFYGIEKQIKNKRMAPDFVMKNIKDTERTKDERDYQWRQAEAELQNKKGNAQSIKDMANQKNIGGNSTTQTIGPIEKGNNVTADNQNQTLNYSTAKENGPKFKENNEENVD